MAGASTTRRGGRAIAWIQKLLPWLAAAAIVAVLLTRFSASAVLQHLDRPGALAVPPILLLTALISLAALASGDRIVLATTFGPVRTLDLARGRAGTAMLVGLHHGLSAGGYGLWLVRTRGTPLSAGIGAVAYITALDLAAGLTVALTGAALTGVVPGGSAAPVVLGLAITGLALVLLAGLGGRRVLGERAARWPVLALWSRVPARAFLGGLAFRTANVAVWTLGTWAALRAFGLEVPLLAVAATLPLVAVIAALPLSVGGLGAAQGAWLVGFSPWAAGEEILAFQLVLHWSATLAFVVRGLPCWRRVVREVAGAT